MSTVCDRFGKRAEQQEGENELNRVEVSCALEKAGGSGRKIGGEGGTGRAREARPNYYTRRERERE